MAQIGGKTMSYSYLIIKRADIDGNLHHSLVQKKFSVIANKHPLKSDPFIDLREAFTYAYQLPDPGKGNEYVVIRYDARPSGKTVELGILSTYDVPRNNGYGVTHYGEPLRVILQSSQLTDTEMLDYKKAAAEHPSVPALRSPSIGEMVEEFQPSEERLSLHPDQRSAVKKLLTDEINRLNVTYTVPTEASIKRIASLQKALDFFNSKQAISYQEAFFYLGYAEKEQVGTKSWNRAVRSLFGSASSTGGSKIRDMITALKKELKSIESTAEKVNTVFKFK